MNEKLHTASDAARLLGVSRPTFQKVRQQYHLPEIKIGKRVRFRESDLIKLTRGFSENEIARPQEFFKKRSFDIFSLESISKLEIKKNVFDLRCIEFIDTFGVLSLLTTVIARAQAGDKIKLILEDNYICHYLFQIHFFKEIERNSGGKIYWNKINFDKHTSVDLNNIFPIISVQKGVEKNLLESISERLKRQNFSKEVLGYVSWIIGELVDNIFTHSHAVLSERRCFFLLDRFIIGDSICLTMGIADLGLGIPASLKHNIKHIEFSDEKALLYAFKSYVSCWDDAYGRGKGLTDIIKIAMSNNSYFRVSSGDSGFFMDFRDKQNPAIKKMPPLTSLSGTRYGLVLFDHPFSMDIKRKHVDEFLKSEIERLGL